MTQFELGILGLGAMVLLCALLAVGILLLIRPAQPPKTDAPKYVRIAGLLVAYSPYRPTRICRYYYAGGPFLGDAVQPGYYGVPFWYPNISRPTATHN